MTIKTPPATPEDRISPDSMGGKRGLLDRRRLRGDESAQRIIHATIELIAEEGVSAITMQRIAARVGSSNALVVFHFGSKDNLFATILTFLTDQYAALWDKTVRQPDMTLENRILAASDVVRQFVRQHPAWAAAWIAFSSDRKTMLTDRQISLPNEVGYVAEVHAMIAEIAHKGAYTEVDTAALSEGLNFLVQGAWYWNNINPTDTTFDTLGKTTRLLLHAAFPRNFPIRRPEAWPSDTEPSGSAKTTSQSQILPGPAHD